MLIIFVVGVLVVIPVVVGFCSFCSCFTRCANKGHKRRFCRYTAPCTDAVYLVLAIVALVVSKETHSLRSSLRYYYYFMARLTNVVP